MDDIDVVEWNGSLAIIDVLLIRLIPNHIGKYNLFGGALRLMGIPMDVLAPY